MRAVELQLKTARILATRDRSTGELYTFYRKEDLQQDAKSTLGQVVDILRKHNCHTSAKHAVQTADLLRPDQERLHRLFLAAVASLVTATLAKSEDVVALNPVCFMLRCGSQSCELDRHSAESQNRWQLMSTHTQLLSTGQIIAWLKPEAPVLYERLSEGMQQPIGISSQPRPVHVLLAPTCSPARYNGGYVGTLPISTASQDAGNGATFPHQRPRFELAWQRVWKDSVVRWLQLAKLGADVGDVWVEVELPLSRAEDSQLATSQDYPIHREVSWFSIFWPRSLCFASLVQFPARCVTTSDADRSDVNLFHDDPLQWAENWMRYATEQPAAPAESDSPSTSVNELQHGRAQADVGQSSHQRTSLDGQSTINIYPTPPDGTMPQVAHESRLNGDTGGNAGDDRWNHQSAISSEHADTSTAAQIRASIGSGLYDEDLFDDVSAQVFRDVAMTDEPNWDFFDQPKQPRHTATSDTSQHKAMVSEDTRLSMLSERHGGARTVERPAAASATEVETESNKGSQGQKIMDEGSIRLNQTASSPSSSSCSAKNASLASSGSFHYPFPLDVHGHGHLPLPGIVGGGRSGLRSLAAHYDPGKVFPPELASSDNRYTADGPFWFDATIIERPSMGGSACGASVVPKIGRPKHVRHPAEVAVSHFDSEVESSTSSFQESDFHRSDCSTSDRPARPEMAFMQAPQPTPGSISKADTVEMAVERSIHHEVVQLLEALDKVDLKDNALAYQPVQPRYERALPTDEETLLSAAQILVNQASQNSLYHADPENLGLSHVFNRVDLANRANLVYGSASEVDLAKLSGLTLSTQDLAADCGFSLCARSRIRVGRNNATIDALQTIQPFWETIDLQPISGEKSVTAFCIHPPGRQVVEGSSALLQRLGEVFDSCNLGSHRAGLIHFHVDKGLLQWELTGEPAMGQLLKVCENFGLLSASLSEENTIVVYIVNPFCQESAVADICNAFAALSQRRAEQLNNNNNNNSSLVLRIVPVSFILSVATAAVPAQEAITRLAFEVYNECPERFRPDTIASSAAAVVLAEKMPDKVSFKLTPETPCPPSTSGDHLHLAYSETADQRWIVACWSDNLGITALTMVYCLGYEGMPPARPRREVLEEMWSISADLMIRNSHIHHLVVAREGPMGLTEMKEWSQIGIQTAIDRRLPRLTLSILTFDASPLAHFPLPPMPSRRASNPGVAAGAKYDISTSTPLAAAAVSSPEQAVTSTLAIPNSISAGSITGSPSSNEYTGGQPGQGLDLSLHPDATLHDSTDDCWSFILPFGLNASQSIFESRPALSSGFLLRRCGLTDHNGVAALCANLLYTTADRTSNAGTAGGGGSSSSSSSSSQSQHTILMRHLLALWRDLYTLTKTKGLAGKDEILPWHIRTAVLGRRAVSDMF